MRGIPKLSFAALAASLCCSGATTPTTQTGDSHVPTTASGPASGRPAGAPRGHVSEEEALKPRPDLPPDKRAFVVVGPADKPEERPIDAEAAEAAGYTLLDLGDDWTPFIFAEQTDASGRAAAQPLPARLPGAGQRSAGRRRRAAGAGGQELPGAVRHLPVALRAARALHEDAEQHPCHDQESARGAGGGRDRHLRAPRRTCARTSRSWRACARSSRRRAARRRCRRWTSSWQRQPAMAPKVKLLARTARPRSRRWRRSSGG